MSDTFTPSRRHFIVGGLGLATCAGLAIAKPSDIGQNHNAYFNEISQALDIDKLSKPSLVIDKHLLIENIQTLKKHISERFDYRIVAKSLPSIPLLKLVMKEADTDKLMIFHQPFLNQVALALPESDILMGKPMPVNAAANFYRLFYKQTSKKQEHLEQNLALTFNPETQLQWLIDSPERLNQYQFLANELNIKLQLNIELDVGFHRGGVEDDQVFVQMLHQINTDENLSFSGLMGYEPHVAKVPGRKLALRDQAMARYQAKLDLALEITGKKANELTLNSAGSPTYQYYDEGNYPHNEIAAGSCLVKPSDFDLDTLADHKAAAFVATPVLKVMQETQIPGVEGLAKLMALWNPNRQKTFYTYGGNWKAQPVSPIGLSINPVWGHSTNQEMLNGSDSIQLKADDWIFLRPTQSEFVFLQFGDIALYDKGKISEYWPVFNEQVV